MLAHLSHLAVPVVAAIVIRLTVGRKDAFVRHHASEALNAQIWFTILWNVLVGGFVVAASTQAGEVEPPAWIFLVIPLAFLTGALMLVGSIVAAVQANRGVWWRYPLPFRFVSGAMRPER